MQHSKLLLVLCFYLNAGSNGPAPEAMESDTTSSCIGSYVDIKKPNFGPPSDENSVMKSCCFDEKNSIDDLVSKKSSSKPSDERNSFYGTYNFQADPMVRDQLRFERSSRQKANHERALSLFIEDEELCRNDLTDKSIDDISVLLCDMVYEFNSLKCEEFFTNEDLERKKIYSSIFNELFVLHHEYNEDIQRNNIIENQEFGINNLIIEFENNTQIASLIRDEANFRSEAEKEEKDFFALYFKHSKHFLGITLKESELESNLKNIAYESFIKVREFKAEKINQEQNNEWNELSNNMQSIYMNSMIRHLHNQIKEKDFEIEQLKNNKTKQSDINIEKKFKTEMKDLKSSMKYHIDKSDSFMRQEIKIMKNLLKEQYDFQENRINVLEADILAKIKKEKKKTCNTFESLSYKFDELDKYLQIKISQECQERDQINKIKILDKIASTKEVLLSEINAVNKALFPQIACLRLNEIKNKAIEELKPGNKFKEVFHNYMLDIENLTKSLPPTIGGENLTVFLTECNKKNQKTYWINIQNIHDIMQEVYSSDKWNNKLIESMNNLLRKL